MRVIVLGLVVSLLALTFATTSTRADSITATASEVATSCFDYDLTVANDDRGATISGVVVFASWTDDSAECPTQPAADEAPPGWSREVLNEGAGSLFAKWGADSGKSGIKKGHSLPGFIVRVGACPLTVDLWATFKKNGVQTALGSFVIPCPE